MIKQDADQIRRALVPIAAATIAYAAVDRHLAQDALSCAFGVDAPLAPALVFLMLVAIWYGLQLLGQRSQVVTGAAAVCGTVAVFSGPAAVRGWTGVWRLGILILAACIPFVIAKRKLISNTPAQPRRYIPTLDGWRCVAILVVVVDHVNFTQSASGHAHWNVLFQGQHGVELFFIISGFLITSLLLDEIDRHGTADLKAFYYRRIYRILPAAYAYLGALALLSVLGYLILTWNVLTASLLFVGNYWYAPNFLNHFWSLAVEEQFYLLLPIAVVALRRRTFVVAAVITCVVIAGWRWYALFSGHLVLDGGFRSRFRTDLRLDTLLYGALLAFALRDPKITERMRRLLHPIVWVGLLVWLAYDCRTPDGYPTPLRNLLMTALIAGTLVRPLSFAGRILELPLVRWVGRISYSLYLWQNLFCFVTPPLRIFWFQRFPYNVGASFVAASISFYCVERPILQWSRRAKARIWQGREYSATRPSSSAHGSESYAALSPTSCNSERS